MDLAKRIEASVYAAEPLRQYNTRCGRSPTRLGYTRERIRQLEQQALAALRDPDRHEPLLVWAS